MEEPISEGSPLTFKETASRTSPYQVAMAPEEREGTMATTLLFPVSELSWLVSEVIFKVVARTSSSETRGEERIGGKQSNSAGLHQFFSASQFNVGIISYLAFCVP